MRSCPIGICFVAMGFCTLELRPKSAAVDVEALEAHLAALPYAVRDPVDGECWFLCATPRCALHSRQARLDDKTRRPYTLLVFVEKEAVYLAGEFARAAELRRGRQLVEWLLTRDAWTGREAEYRDAVTSADPLSFFADDLPAPEDIVDDHSISPVIEGALWSIHPVNANDAQWTELALHTSGQWTFWTACRIVRGWLTPDAIAEWTAAVGSAEIAQIEESDLIAEAAVQLQRETSTDCESAFFVPPTAAPSCQRVVDLMMGWRAAIAAWSDGPPPKGIASIVSTAR